MPDTLRYHEKKIVIWEDNEQVNTLWRWLTETCSADILEIPVGLPVGTDPTGASPRLAWQAGVHHLETKRERS